MGVGFARCLSVKLTKRGSELVFVGTNEFRVFLPVQVEVELRNRTDVESLPDILKLRKVDSAENNLGVVVASCGVFENRLEAHAWSTSRGPKVDNQSWLLLDQKLQMSQRDHLDNLAHLWLSEVLRLRLLLLLLRILLATHVVELLHELLHQVLIFLAHARHSWHTALSAPAAAFNSRRFDSQSLNLLLLFFKNKIRIQAQILLDLEH